MYREPATPQTEAPPAELLYPVVDRERRGVTAAFQLVSFPLAVAALLSMVTIPAVVAIAGMAGSTLLGVWWWHGSPENGVLLRVEGDELCVLAAGSKKLRARMRLADLADVTLDTRTTRPMMEGDSPIPGLRFLNSQPLPEADQKRIVLVAKSGEVPLTEAYLANGEVTEWFGKIRVFLRRHAWVPTSERE